MSVLSSTYVQCEVIQRMLNDEFEACTNILDPMPALEAILATQKANGISQTVSDGTGKVKNVKVVYEQRLLESAATVGSGARSCSTEVETFNDFANYTIDPTVWIKGEESFDVVDLATVCTEDVQSMIARKINKIIDVIERRVATKTAAELVTLTGKWSTSTSTSYTVNGSDELVLAQYVSAATKVIDYSSMVALDGGLQMTGYCAPAIIVGGNALADYMKFANHGCCAANGVNVLDIANEYGKAVMFDKRVQTALGSNLKSIAFQSGSLALIHYNEASQVPMIGANYAKFRINSPRTGLPIDIVMKDDCGHISIIGYANTLLVGLPVDMFAVGDDFRGVKFVNKILITNPA